MEGKRRERPPPWKVPKLQEIIRSSLRFRNGGSTSPHFLNRDFTDSGIRRMWVQLKFAF